MVPLARAAGVPVIVDAAFQCLPVTSFGRWARAGDRRVLLGQVLRRAERGRVRGGVGCARSRDVAALDFVGYESGPWRTFGRAWKLDRATVVATVTALEEWVDADHDGAAGRVRGAGRAVWRGLVGGSLCQFTLDERVLFERAVQRGAGAGARAGSSDALAAGDPSVRAMATATICCSAWRRVSSREIDEIGAAMSARCPN